MNILKFKIILSTFTGIFLYISHMMIYREITADSDFPFFSALFFLLFLSLWTGIGILLSPFKAAKKPRFLFPLLCIAPASLLSLIVLQLLTACYPVQNYTNLALVALAGCFPSGITFGVILVSAKHSVSPHLQKYVAFSAAMGYLSTGFILYPLELFNVLSHPAAYMLIGNSLVVLVAVAVLSFKQARSIRYWFMVFAIIIMALNFSLWQLEKYTNKVFFTMRYPAWQLEKSYLTHFGRITLLKQEKLNRLMLLKNTQIQQIIPDDYQLYKTTIIPFSLQPNKAKLRVLAIGSSFSFIPTMLGSLPYVRHVTMLAGGRSSLPLNILRLLPPQSDKVSMLDIGANEYLRNSSRKFDLIIWLSPNQEYLNFDSIIKLCASRMRKDGVIAIPGSLLAVNNAQSICTATFENKISIPGKSLVYAFSNAPLTSDLKILEKRLDRLDDRETKLFHPGTFSIIYSIPKKTSLTAIPSNKRAIENLLLKSFNSLKINLKTILIILAVSFVYFIGRFFVLRRKKLHAAAGIFENGLCLMLLMMILTTLYAQREGAFYYNFGVILAVVSGAPAGIALSQFKLRRLAVVMSIIVIFLSSLQFWEYHSYFIPAIAYISFLSGGVIIAKIFKQNSDADMKLLPVHFLASALGVALMFALLIMHFNLFSSLLIVLLFRIPLIFSKMALSGDK
ncbi:MAG: hypothetical protein KOO69_01995 [Victivallales bacterium]|nr:hypothetical protein [Victivallales bacterium]